MAPAEKVFTEFQEVEKTSRNGRSDLTRVCSAKTRLLLGKVLIDSGSQILISTSLNSLICLMPRPSGLCSRIGFVIYPTTFSRKRLKIAFTSNAAEKHSTYRSR